MDRSPSVSQLLGLALFLFVLVVQDSLEGLPNTFQVLAPFLPVQTAALDRLMYPTARSFMKPLL